MNSIITELPLENAHNNIRSTLQEMAVSKEKIVDRFNNAVDDKQKSMLEYLFKERSTWEKDILTYIQVSINHIYALQNELSNSYKSGFEAGKQAGEREALAQYGIDTNTSRARYNASNRESYRFDQVTQAKQKFPDLY
jgi:hypothetical protein